MDKTSLKKDYIVSVSLIVISIVMYATTFSFERLTTSQIGSEFAPRLVAVGIFLLSLLLLIGTALKSKKVKNVLLNKEAASLETANREEYMEDSNQETETKEGLSRFSKYINVLSTLVLILVYIAALEKIGFLVSTSVYLFLQCCLLAKKKYWNIPLFAILSIVVSVVVYFSFRYGFDLMLPEGILG